MATGLLCQSVEQQREDAFVLKGEPLLSGVQVMSLAWRVPLRGDKNM